MKELTASEYVFLKWLHDTHPQLYALAEERQKGLGGFMDSLSSVFTNIANAAPAVLTQYVKGEQELAVLKANLARAKAGDVPLSANGQPYYGAGLTGGARSDFGGVPLWAWLAGGGVIVYLLLRK